MPTVVGVRFKRAGKIYFFDPGGFDLKKSDRVVLETARGLEFGEVVIPPREVSKDDLVLPLKTVIRPGTEQDGQRVAENQEKQAEAFKICEEKISKHQLPMKLIDVEYTFDKSKIIFYFTAEGRVDFRELVKSLAAIFRTRIELRQIGVRDEAKMVGGIGSCGRVLCCHSFLGDFEPVSIRMAKEQNLSLNPTKISGVCGRLMCCLKYESEVYEGKNAPGENAENADSAAKQASCVDCSGGDCPGGDCPAGQCPKGLKEPELVGDASEPVPVAISQAEEEISLENSEAKSSETAVPVTDTKEVDAVQIAGERKETFATEQAPDTGKPEPSGSDRAKTPEAAPAKPRGPRPRSGYKKNYPPENREPRNSSGSSFPSRNNAQPAQNQTGENNNAGNPATKSGNSRRRGRSDRRAPVSDRREENVRPEGQNGSGQNSPHSQNSQNPRISQQSNPRNSPNWRQNNPRPEEERDNNQAGAKKGNFGPRRGSNRKKSEPIRTPGYNRFNQSEKGTHSESQENLPPKEGE